MVNKKMRITLAKLFSISLIALVVLLGALFYFLLHASKASVMDASDNLRDSASRQLVDKVSSFFAVAKVVENNFQSEINHDILNPKDLVDLETALFSMILTNNSISEISFTYGDKEGYDAAGNIQLKPTGRGEMSLFRTESKTSSPIDTRSITQNNGKWVSQLRKRTPQNDLFGTPFITERANSIVDPTTHLTFLTPANKQNIGKYLWSDLHWSQIDSHLPEDQRRVEVSLQKTVTDTSGNFLGVLRVGLSNKEIDSISQFKLIPDDPNDPHIVFIADNSGKLITRLNDINTLRSTTEGDLRYSSENIPIPVQISLEGLADDPLTKEQPLRFNQFDYQGETYLVTYRQIEGSQDWVLGIVVPQSYYAHALKEVQHRLLLITGIIIAGLCIGGYFLQRSIKAEQTKIINETVKVHNFDFKPTQPHSRFQDVFNILSSLELAKTAMRAMSKYVPVELVRQLYQSQKEPTLGGEIQDVSILFTDIQNFTSISEKLPVNELANALGSYLKVMTQNIENNQGIIDKYIGDGIMALWNAPKPLQNHVQIACQAVLDCRIALQELFASQMWQNLPHFDTRFGLHDDRVMVGHFGAPDRLNYTVIGNGVNVASRLESLNKQYGTSILVSENIFEAAREVFDFRLIDLVAVKGKTEGINVYELIGKKGEKLQMSATISKYEEALGAYRKRNFEVAKNLLKDQLSDGPSHTLYDRCTMLLQHPPPDSWNGIFISTMK